MPKAKKSKPKVVISQEYLDLLTDKASLLEEIFGNGDASITPGDFKTYTKFAKADDKVDATVDSYEPPSE